MSIRIYITVVLLIGLSACGGRPSPNILIEKSEVILVCRAVPGDNKSYAIIDVLKNASGGESKFRPGATLKLRALAESGYPRGDKQILFIGSEIVTDLSVGRDYSMYEVYDNEIPSFGDMDLSRFEIMVQQQERRLEPNPRPQVREQKTSLR